MNDSNIVQQPVAGIKSGRIITAILGSATAGTALADILVPATGDLATDTALFAIATGTSLLFSLTRVKSGIERNTKKLFHSSSKNVSMKNVTRSFFGLKPEQEKVYVSTTPFVSDKTYQQQISSPKIRKIRTITAPSAAKYEADNYVIYSPQGIRLEQVIRSTPLAVWDDSFMKIHAKYNLPMTTHANNNPRLAIEGFVGDVQNAIKGAESKKAIENIVNGVQGTIKMVSSSLEERERIKSHIEKYAADAGFNIPIRKTEDKK